MASFAEDLWNSIFTPGPTPTLLIATNLAFAGLQAVLLGLLIATYSIHFVVLSFLCTGLWWGINWFAKEVQAAQAADEEAKRRGQATDGTHKDRRRGVDGAGSDMDSGDDTETEVEDPKKSLSSSSPGVADAKPAATSKGSVEGSTSASLQVPADSTRKRRGLAESSGDISTDSEWEKVEGEQ